MNLNPSASNTTLSDAIMNRPFPSPMQRGRIASGSRLAYTVSLIISARLYAPTSREVNSFSARLTSPPKFTISFARSRTMTSLSEVVMKAQPFLLSSSRISSAFAMSPLCASAMSPYEVLTTIGWAFSRTLDPVVEYRTWPIPLFPRRSMRSSFEKTSCTRPMPRFDFISPLYTARPADSWPRCWRTRNPKKRSVVTGVVPEQPMIPHFSRGRRSENSDVAWSGAMVNASSPRSNSAVSSSVRSRRRRNISSVCDTRADRNAGIGCGRSSVPSSRATRSPSSSRPPTSWRNVDDVISADNRKVHLPLGLIVLHLLRIAEDEVHVRVESVEDPAVPSPAFQLNHHVRTDPLVEERKRLNHRTTTQPWRRRT